MLVLPQLKGTNSFQQLEVHTTYGDFFRFSQEGFFTWLDFLRMPEVQQNLYAVGGN